VGVDVLVRESCRIPVTGYDGETLPFDDDSFDAVCFVDVLHHTDDPVRHIAEASRVSRGPILVKDHLADDPLAGITLRAMDWVGNAHHGVRLPYNYLRKGQWLEIAASLGLVIDGWRTDLGLYAPPLTWWFDRRLHVIFVMRPPR
jgi:SAM-dependent methyltransferase